MMAEPAAYLTTRIFGKFPRVPANETLILAYICASTKEWVIKHVLRWKETAHVVRVWEL